MKSALVGLVLLVGCADSAVDTAHDTGTDDVEDPDAKADAASRPTGIYTLIDPNGFEEGMPRFEHFDLRRDGTYYVYEIGPVDNEGNFEEGYNSYFGTYKLTRDRYDNKYIRMKTADGSSWREKYTVKSGVMSFYYRGGEVGWTMKHDDVTETVRKATRDAFESGDGRRKVTQRASSHPDAVWSHYYDVQDIDGYAVSTLHVGDDTRYMLTSPSTVEIYAANDQLLAEGTIETDGTVDWNDDL